MTDQVTIKANDDSNPQEFWAAFDESYPEIADSVREGETVVEAATWEAIQQLEGFADGPVEAVPPQVEPETPVTIEREGPYEVDALQAGGFAVVNVDTGQVHSEYSDRREAVTAAQRLNQDGE